MGRAGARAALTVWKRELIRFSRSKIRVVTSFAQPILYLFVFGVGLGRLVGRSNIGFDFQKFLFPGVVSMTILFSAVFSAISIVWDREFGFLREMLVAPVPRSGLVVGKALGGATVATMQGAFILVLMPLVGLRPSILGLLEALAVMALLAFTLTCFGIVVAARMQRIESFQVVMQFFLMPVFFLSGALFPTSNLPGWLSTLTLLDPMTYGVVALRRIMFAGVELSAEARQAAGLDLHWGGWALPGWAMVGVMVAVGAVMLAISVATFRTTE